MHSNVRMSPYGPTVAVVLRPERDHSLRPLHLRCEVVRGWHMISGAHGIWVDLGFGLTTCDLVGRAQYSDHGPW